MHMEKHAAPIHDEAKARVYYHGTDREDLAQKIMAEGIQPREITMPEKAKSRAMQAPVPDRVYMTDNFGYAAIYALGGSMFGSKSTKFIEGKDPFGYIFAINGSDLLGDVVPDEDSIGEALYWRIKYTDDIRQKQELEEKLKKGLGTEAQRKSWQYLLDGRKDQIVNAQPVNRPETPDDIKWELDYLANKMTEGQRRRLEEAAVQSQVGKKLQKYLSKNLSKWLLENGAHLAHRGAVHPVKAWKIDKVKAVQVGGAVENWATEIPLTKVASKTAYLSSMNGELNITIVRAERPEVTLQLDLGIPNFTVFTLKFPCVEDNPQGMQEMVTEGIRALLDEVSSFMLSMEYEQDVIVKLYAAVLQCYKDMTNESDTQSQFSDVSRDPTIKTYEGTFKMPISFIDETQKRVVTGALNRYDLWAIVNGQVEIFKNADLNKRFGHVAWFSKLGLPTSGGMFDSIPRGDARISPSGLITIGESSEGQWWTGDEEFLSQVVSAFEREYPQAHVVTRKYAGSGKLIQRAPAYRHLELLTKKPDKNDLGDVARVIRQYKSRSLKTQPKPLYVVVYDQRGKPSGTLSLGNNFRNKLFQMMKGSSAETPEFTDAVAVETDNDLRYEVADGIPKSISVGTDMYFPEGFVGADMAIYLCQSKEKTKTWMVKFSDGRMVRFTDRPSLQALRAKNYPVPDRYTRWNFIRNGDEPLSNEVTGVQSDFES
jgi:hypothetical protein